MIIGMNLRVVIVDDHARFREQARELPQLERSPSSGRSHGSGGLELARQLNPISCSSTSDYPIRSDSTSFRAPRSGAAVVLTSSRALRDYGGRGESGAEGFIARRTDRRRDTQRSGVTGGERAQGTDLA